MIRRMAVVCVAMVALIGAADAVAKKKKPKIKTGPYVGTTSNGIDLNVTLDPGRKSGSIAYCGLFTTFTVDGRSFAVSYQDPVSLTTLSATGSFNAKKRSVSGTIGPTGCDGSTQTYTLTR